MEHYNHGNVKRARELRANMTPWERKLWYCFLKSYPIRFQGQKCIDQYIIDFYCARGKIAIELDGSGHYVPEAEQYDRNRTKMLERYGIKVIRFCNTDIDNQFDNVCAVIDLVIKERMQNE